MWVCFHLTISEHLAEVDGALTAAKNWTIATAFDITEGVDERASGVEVPALAALHHYRALFFSLSASLFLSPVPSHSNAVP
jgi:hypothetical protein